MPRPTLLLTISLGLLGLVVGCGQSGPKLSTVTGKVTLNGEPLEGAIVIFSPLGEGRPSAGRTDKQGEYSLSYTQDRRGALPGEHRVSVSTFQSGDPDADRPLIPERVPPQYNQNSELQKTVDAGRNTIHLELEGTMPPSKQSRNSKVVPASYRR